MHLKFQTFKSVSIEVSLVFSLSLMFDKSSNTDGLVEEGNDL